MLRAHSQRHADGVHVSADVLAVDGGRPGGGREHTGQDRPERGKERSRVKQLHIDTAKI